MPLSQDLRKKLKISTNRTDKLSSSSTTISRSDSNEISQNISQFAINNGLPDGKHLGAGVYGAVYATEWQKLQCAMKIFNNVTNGVSFRREAVILGDLRHPNAVQLYGFSREESKSRIILELTKTDLRALTDSFKKYSTHPFSSPIALDIIFQISKGLRYLHDRVGTTPWRAPELFVVHSDCYVDEEGKSKLRSYPKKADIYSVGITCSEILIGLRPFQNCNQGDMYARITDQGERPSLVPLLLTFPAIPMLFSPYHKNKQTVREMLGRRPRMPPYLRGSI